MAEQWEWEEVYIRFQTAVMDESTAREKKNKSGGGRPHAFHCLKLSRCSACVELCFVFCFFFPTTIDVIGTMEHLEEEPEPTRPLLFGESVILKREGEGGISAYKLQMRPHLRDVFVVVVVVVVVVAAAVAPKAA